MIDVQWETVSSTDTSGSWLRCQCDSLHLFPWDEHIIKFICHILMKCQSLSRGLHVTTVLQIMYFLLFELALVCPLYDRLNSCSWSYFLFSFFDNEFRCSHISLRMWYEVKLLNTFVIDTHNYVNLLKYFVYKEHLTWYRIWCWHHGWFAFFFYLTNWCCKLLLSKEILYLRSLCLQ